MTRLSKQQMREQEDKLIGNRLETIAEVKREIEAKCEIVNELFATQLQKALNYLQDAENFKLDNDNFNAFGSLEKAKSLARKTLLEFQTLQMLEMTDWQVGYKKGKNRITNLWKTYIEPSFDLPAFLCVVHFEDYIDGILSINTSEETLSMSHIHARFPKNWADIVVEQVIDLSNKDDKLSLDGIYYEFELISVMQKIQIECWNPHSISLVELENALVKTAERIAYAQANQNGINYIDNVWIKYTHDKK